MPCSKLYTIPKLKLLSIPVAISVVMGVFQTFLVFTVLHSIGRLGLNLKRSKYSNLYLIKAQKLSNLSIAGTTLVYTITCYMEFLMFIRISRVWPKIALLWQSLERAIFFQIPYTSLKPFALRSVMWMSSSFVMLNIFGKWIFSVYQI